MRPPVYRRWLIFARYQFPKLKGTVGRVSVRGRVARTRSNCFLNVIPIDKQIADGLPQVIAVDRLAKNMGHGENGQFGMAFFRSNINGIRRHNFRDLRNGHQSFKPAMHKDPVRAGYPYLLDPCFDQNPAQLQDGATGGNLVIIDDRPPLPLDGTAHQPADLHLGIRNAFLVARQKVFYRPPVLNDYWKYLARMRWQEEQRLKAYGDLFADDKDEPRRFWSGRVAKKLLSGQGLRRTLLGVASSGLRTVVKSVFKARIDRYYRDLGPVCREGRNILSQATRSESAK